MKGYTVPNRKPRVSGNGYRTGDHRADSGDGHLDMLLTILWGIPQWRREEWMSQNCPNTLAVLANSALFNPIHSPYHRRQRGIALTAAHELSQFVANIS